MRSLFQLGRHMLAVFGHEDWWVVAVDGILLHARFPSKEEAWAAGIEEVNRLEARWASAGPTP